MHAKEIQNMYNAINQSSFNSIVLNIIDPRCSIVCGKRDEKKLKVFDKFRKEKHIIRSEYPKASDGTPAVIAFIITQSTDPTAQL